MAGAWDFRTPDLLGPTYQALGSLVPNALGSYKQGLGLYQDQQRRQALAELAAQGNVSPQALGQKMLALGDIDGSLAAIRLGELQEDRGLQRQKLQFEIDQARQERADREGTRTAVLGMMGLGGQPAPPAPSASGAMRGYNNPAAKAEYDFAISKGLTPIQAAAYTGAKLAESRFDPNARNPGDGRDGSDSVGVFQWNGQRAQALKNYAAQQGKDWRDPQVQREFAFNEMDGPESFAGRALRSAKTPEEAAAAMLHYLRPAGYTRQNPLGAGSAAARIANTNGIYAAFAGQTPQAMPAVASSADAPFVRPDMDPARLRADAQALAASNPTAARQMAMQADEIDRMRQGAAPVQTAQAQTGTATDAGQAQTGLARMTNQQLQLALLAPKLDPAFKSLFEGEIARRRAVETEERQFQRRLDAPSDRKKQAVEAGLVPGTKEFSEFMRGENRQKSLEETTAERARIADAQGYQGDERKLFIANGRLPTAAEKAPTEGQSNAGMYADRMSEAHTLLSDPKIISAMMSPQQKAMEAVPFGVGNYGMTTEGQKALQAQRNFVNAILRKESGAAIGQGEFDNARKQYFPQPGDSAEVIRQKQANRETAIAGLKRAAGPGYAKEQAAKPSGTPQPNRTPNGVTWSVE